ncbi:class A beta-lactamase [Metabacillus sp. RGM 3146]|uniref:class A beta-lactamase n=1 Tax=Metabacillus sp. RGM 3146 TaxID=3401092 RepID=UPI003B9AC6A6
MCLSLTGLLLNSIGTNQANAEGKASRTSHAAKQKLVKLEKEFDARLGVYAFDTGTKKMITYRADERFPFASTYKALAAGAVLQQKSLSQLDEVIHYTKNDLVTYSPITEKHVDTGMTLKEICDAAIRYSDNTAGNLLFQQLGGPDGFENAMRQIGDRVIESDRLETDLNEALPGDIRDTSTPRALAKSLKAFAADNVLTADKRTLLTDWMKGNTTGDHTIRAGVPKGWVVGDKTGTGSYGTRNDIAVIWPPNRAPIVMAILSTKDAKDAAPDDALIAQAAKIVFKALK